MKIIIYNDENGGMHRLRPTAEFLAEYDIQLCAQKDVPAGRRYKIIDESELPENWHDRNAWEVSDADLNDGLGAEWSTMDEVQL